MTLKTRDFTSFIPSTNPQCRWSFPQLREWPNTGSDGCSWLQWRVQKKKMAKKRLSLERLVFFSVTFWMPSRLWDSNRPLGSGYFSETDERHLERHFWPFFIKLVEVLINFPCSILPLFNHFKILKWNKSQKAIDVFRGFICFFKPTSQSIVFWDWSF